LIAEVCQFYALTSDIDVGIWFSSSIGSCLKLILETPAIELHDKVCPMPIVHHSLYVLVDLYAGNLLQIIS